jgi:hypothetical protein
MNNQLNDNYIRNRITCVLLEAALLNPTELGPTPAQDAAAQLNVRE